MIMMYQIPFDETRRHHKKKTLSPERTIEILHSAHWGTLSTVSENGEAYGVPIGFAFDDDSGTLIFHTANTGHKQDNICRDRRVCFSIVGSDNLITEKFAATFESIVIFGTIEKIEDKEEALAAAIMFSKKFAPKTTESLLDNEDEREYSDMAIMMEKAFQFMAMYRLKPSHISSKKRVLL
jgi:nitroimidazol reductase NimA-like FMN-containing flavoprotein (pyridoxamine 5'-phosphate oxidase superfamily)